MIRVNEYHPIGKQRRKKERRRKKKRGNAERARQGGRTVRRAVRAGVFGRCSRKKEKEEERKKRG